MFHIRMQLIVIGSLCLIAGCSEQPKVIMPPNVVFTPEQIQEIKSEDDRVAFEESHGTMTAGNNLSE